MEQMSSSEANSSSASQENSHICIEL
jgi:hypothetical protein